MGRRHRWHKKRCAGAGGGGGLVTRTVSNRATAAGRGQGACRLRRAACQGGRDPRQRGSGPASGRDGRASPSCRDVGRAAFRSTIMVAVVAAVNAGNKARRTVRGMNTPHNVVTVSPRSTREV